MGVSSSNSANPARNSRKFRKFTLKRKSPETRPFRDLVKNWPIEDLQVLLNEFEADLRILELQKKCDNVRKKSRSLGEDLKAAKPDFAVKFKDKSIPTHRHFVENRCKNLKITTNIEKFSETDVENFLTDWIYSENPEKIDKNVLEELKIEFGCQKRLRDDLKDILAADLKNGDLLITIVEENGKDPPFEIRCSSQIATARSPLISMILAQKVQKQITFDARIFPAKFAPAIIDFFYTDQLDFSLIAENPEDSLSEAMALSSGSKEKGKMEILVENCLKILEIAQFFGVQKLVEAAENVICDNVTLENAIRIYQNSSKFVRIQAKRFIEREFSQFSISQLEKLSIDDLKSITRSQFLQTTELELLNSILLLENEEILENIRDSYVIPPLHQNLTYLREKILKNHQEFFCEFHVDAQWLRFSDFASGPRYFKPYHKFLAKKVAKLTENVEKATKIDKSIPELRFDNQFPDVLESEKYLEASEIILRRFGEFWTGSEGFRSFHRDYAIKLITRRTLLELDIPEECLNCHVANCEKPDLLA